MAEAHVLRLYRLKLYGSEAGGRGVNEIIYSSISRKKSKIEVENRPKITFNNLLANMSKSESILDLVKISN